MHYYNERIRFIREAKNITQAEIANAIGTSQKQYSKYETGVNEMTVSRLKAICEYLQVSADYVLDIPKGSWHPPVK